RRIAPRKKGGTAEPGAVRLRKRLEQIAEIDFFGAPVRARIEEAVRQLEGERGAEKRRGGKKKTKDNRERTWITRPQPGIDRVASAWLISRHIDPQAKFAFDKDPRRHPDAIPFDMFNAGGFGHVSNDCTFETLMKSFGIKDSRLRLVAQAVHD